MLFNRLPLFNRDQNVVGCEPRIEWTQDAVGGPCDPLATIAECLDDFAGSGWMLVALPMDKILEGGHEVLPWKRTFIQPLFNNNDRLFLQGLSKLKSKSYRIAWSTPHGAGPGPDPGMVCLDAQGAHERAFAAAVKQAHDDGCSVTARDVNTHETLDLCLEAEVDFFQGRFLFQRSPKPAELPTDQLAAVKLMCALQNPSVLLHDIEELDYFPGDLCSRLLEFTNATEGRRAESIRYAVGAVGIERLRRWASLLLLATVENKPRELCIAAAIRARMCELLADSDNPSRQSMFFSAGICSVLDALLDRPMPQIANDLPVSAEFREALINGSGVIGATLDAVLAFESADWENISLQPYHPTMIRKVYLDALNWTRTICTGLCIQKAASTGNPLLRTA
jgi:EAL and modified HD-GYP domain-containing signal transduction protein